MEQHFRMKAMRIAIATLLGTLGAVSALPAHAESEIAALKRELAEQRELINKLLAAQTNQKEAIEKIEARPAQAVAQAPAQAVAQPAAGQGYSPIKGLTLYGGLDVNVSRANSSYGRKTTIGSGGMNASSLGVKGDKELMKGLHVVALAEMGVDLSTGVAGNDTNGTVGKYNDTASSSGLNGKGNQIFSRQAYAGLASDDYGTITLGRQYSGSYKATTTYSSALGPGFYGSQATYLAIVGGMPTRVNNSAVYRSPSLAGFSVHATYTAGNENNVDGTIVDGTNKITDSSGAGWDMALFYRAEKLTAGMTTWRVKRANFAANETGLARNQGWLAMATYDFNFIKLFSMYVSGKVRGGGYLDSPLDELKPKTPSNAEGWSFGFNVPFGKHTLLANYATINDKSPLNRDGSELGLAYTYKIQDATWLYVNWGKQFNSRHAKYALQDGGDLVGTIPVDKLGYDPSGIMMGVHTKF